jgi:hypothetical protein
MSPAREGMDSVPARMLFVVHGLADEDAFHARVDQLARLYSNLAPLMNARWNAALSLGTGAIRFDDRAANETVNGWFGHWGETPPQACASPEPLVGAGAADLRGLDRSIALVGVAGDRARIVTGATGPVALYRAEGAGVIAWASHGAAASVLAGAKPALDPRTIAQLFAFGFIGGAGTHLRGVSAVSSAADVVIGREGVTERSYWPLAERWAPVPADEAQAHAERHLLGSLSRRLDGFRAPYLGLTAGLDSRAVAVSLRELDIGFRAFTWGEADWPDVVEAARLSEALGLPHVAVGASWLDEADARATAEREAAWREGLGVPNLLAAPAWPDDIDAYVTGGAGETGRAFYYRLLAANAPEPSVDRIQRFWRPEVEIDGAEPDAISAIAQAKGEWLAEAAATGQRGWSLLDVVYGEQRFRRWGRSMLPRTRFPLIAAFAAPEVQRGLASLPLMERVTDGFHRALIRRYAPDLEPLAGGRQRRGIPPVARRVAAAVRRRRRGDQRAAWGLAAEWSCRPRLREWIADDVLRRAVLAEALGEGWVDATRQGFLSDEHRATEHALMAASLALAEDVFARS